MLIRIPATIHVKDAKASTNREKEDGSIIGRLVTKTVKPMEPVDLPEEEALPLLAAYAYLGAVEVGKEPKEEPETKA